MKCDVIRPELVAHLRGELDEARRAEVEVHVASCPDCRSDLEVFRQMGELLSEAELGERPPDHLKETALARVETEDLGRLLSATAAAMPPPDLKDRAMSRALAGKPTKPTATRPRRALTWMAAAAAVTGIAIAAGSQARMQDLDRRLASMQASVRRAERSLGPVGHPMQAFQLAGRTAQADAELVHFKHDNYRMTVKLSNMDVTPPDHHYEMWLSGDEGEVSVGNFRLKRPDDLTLNFTIGVDPGDFPEVLITLEPSDGDPRKSSELVARAQLDRDALYHGPYEE